VYQRYYAEIASTSAGKGPAAAFLASNLEHGSAAHLHFWTANAKEFHQRL